MHRIMYMLYSLSGVLTVMAYNITKRVGTKYGTAIDSGTKSSKVLLDFDSLNL